MTGWHRLGTAVESQADKLAALAKLTGMPFRQLDMVRRVRNQIAHPDQPVPRERLLAALRIIADAEQRIDARKSGRRRNVAARPARKSRPAAGGSRPLRPSGRRQVRGRRGGLRRPSTLVAVVAGVVVAAVAACVVMFDLFPS
jgi:hypothetical protein